MNRNRFLVLAIIALILSGGLTYMVYRVLQGRLQSAESNSKVVVAARKMEFGYRITKDDVRLVEWPKGTPLQGSFEDVNLVVDRATVAPLQINEPILDSKLASKEAGAGLMTVIPDGMRALSIQVNSVIGVSGFVLPGSRVDLILTAIPPKDVKGAKQDEMGSKIILENLEVLAAGQNVQRDVEGKPQTVQDVTLLVTPDQAQRVALATGDGRIQLALRNPLDKKAADPLLVIRSSLYEGPTMEKSESGSAAKAAPDKPEANGRAGSKRPLRSAAAKPVQPKKQEPLVKAPPSPSPQHVVVVELIQGVKRTKDTFEETKPESNETSTNSDGTKQ
ncbi:MAG TPA: Flp pilus assembly protein CpaB [Acidobacteriota bacterium]|nr:Flp pilus assembly protein CpaB [Acidobacteriota bacterium]